MGDISFSATRTVAPDQVILQLQEICFADLILRHRAKAGIYSIYQLIRGEFF